jgi:plastocyanin
MNTFLKWSVIILILAALALSYAVFRERLFEERESTTLEVPQKTEDMPVAAAATIDISNCSPQPTNAVVKNGASVLFVNKDSVRHEIVFDSMRYHEIKAGSSTQVSINFPKGPGIYNYGCDMSGKAVGSLTVTP